VQTLHDLIPFTSDHSGFAADRKRLQVFAERIRGASAVIAASRHVADDGIRLIGLDPARVHVVPHGVDLQFVPPADDSVRTGHPPYVLVVAEYGPNKGYEQAMALAGGLADAGLPHRVKLVGRLAHWVRPTVEALRESSGQSARVDLLDWVSEPQLVDLYQGAVALVVTSRAEGFCFPVVEAMACATPVIAFANSALPEVVGDGGVLVPDGDVGEMIQAVRALATDPAARSDAEARALQRSKTFSWSRTAEHYADIYRAVLHV
jgi:glycosyltransferase involved in cell wall biosynthesis